MTSLIHADIFFFISSIGFIIIFILAIVAAGYFISLLRKINRLTKTLEREAEKIGANAEDIIDDIRSSMVFRFLFGATASARKSASHKKKKAARKE